MLAVAHTGAGEGEDHGLLRAGHRHVEQPALLLHVVGRRGHRHAREEVLLHSGHEHVGELEPLGGMHRHQRDLVVVVLVGAHVHVAQQRDVLHIVVEGEHGHRGSRLLQLVGVHGLLLPLLHEDRDRVQQFVEVRDAREALDRGVELVGGVEAGLLGDAHRHVVGVGERHLGGETRDHVAERLHLGHLLRGAEQRQPLLSGGLLDGVQSDPADSAGGLVDHAAEGLVVLRVDAEAEIAHHVLDLGALEEGVARIDHVGYVAAAQLLLDGARLGVGAVEHGEVAVLGVVGAHPRDDVGDYAHRLLLFGVGLQQPDLLAFLPHRVAFLRDAACVVGDERVGCVDYGRGGAVVPLQPEYVAVGVIFAEIQYVLDLGAAEGVDRLAVVADHADVAVRGGQLLEYQVLGVVGVLVLVHHYVEEALRNRPQRLGVVAQQVVHVQQYVVEVHDPGLLELLLVELVEVAQARPAGMVVGRLQLAAVAVAVHGDQVVLGHGDAGEHLAGLVDLVVEAELLDAGLHGALRVGGVVDHETLRVAERGRVFPQETHEHRMEGAHDQASGRPVTDHRRYPLLHLAGRLLGEGQREYPRRIRLFGEQKRYSARQDPGLSRTGAGHDEHGPPGAADGILLLLVQPLQYYVNFLLHRGTKLRKKWLSSQRILHILK